MLRSVLTLLLFAITSVSFGQSNPAPHELQNQLENLRLKHQIPGASIALIKNGKIAWRHSLGYADLKTKRKINNTTLFQAASITKTLTAATRLLDYFTYVLNKSYMGERASILNLHVS